MDASKPPQQFSKEILILPVDACIVHPANFREVDPAHVAELAASMKHVGFDSDHPVKVVKSTAQPGKWEITAGKHRHLAAQAAGIPHVFALDKTPPDLPGEIEVVFDVARSNTSRPLDLIETGRLFLYMKTKYGTTQEEFGAAIGKSQSFVSQALGVQKIASDPELGPHLHGLQRGALIALTKAPPAAQVEIARQAIEDQLSVRQVNEAVHRERSREEFRNASGESPPEPRESVYFRIPQSVKPLLDKALETISAEESLAGDPGMALGALVIFYLQTHVPAPVEADHE